MIFLVGVVARARIALRISVSDEVAEFVRDLRDVLAVFFFAMTMDECFVRRLMRIARSTFVTELVVTVAVRARQGTAVV